MPFLSVQELRSHAAGRWTDILVSAGIPASVLDGRNHPCPKCGGSDRFATFRDFELRGAVHCRHCFTAGSPIAPGDGVHTLRWWLGTTFTETLEYLSESIGYRAADAGMSKVPSPLAWQRFSVASPAVSKPLEMDVATIEAHTQFAREAYHQIDSPTRNRLARRLGVAPISLTALRIGITSDGKCSTWPMRDGQRKIVGVRLVGLPWTQSAGAKWSRRESHNGLFIPMDHRADCSRLFVTEGASDTAAANSLGLFAIGRASCDASTFFVNQFIRQNSPKRITIIADNDPPGRKGASRLASMLAGQLVRGAQTVDVICPPGHGMDLRDWIAAGANQTDVIQALPIKTPRQSVQQQFDFDTV